ncbi:aminotransferase class I and II domain-containing protein [Ditylenchus destructor]|uniref:Aminotransferase class I and II domain-containing protein n=1 Tax=Ditylenchus destructor TaxID=166010 RepID=A0AAD4QRJ7_9BILA|nr:aminotransferase class I and II domain-containing protein [Ditylenchus destructor]
MRECRDGWWILRSYRSRAVRNPCRRTDEARAGADDPAGRRRAHRGRAPVDAESLCEQLSRPCRRSARRRSGDRGHAHWGAGLASVRFICGTQTLHKQLEAETAAYLGYDDAILFAAAFDANGGVFEPLLSAEDAIVSDTLNHASIIDGVRLSKAKRYRYATSDIADLERVLKTARADGARTILIATDGVFSMDGAIAPLDEIAALAQRFDALLLVDDCHATGIIGEGGRGSGAFRGVADKVDILTGTYGKALGGAMGGFVAARQPVIDLLRQRARPYLFSNALAPAICGASLAAIGIAASDEGDALRRHLAANAALFRDRLTHAGFDLLPGEHPIIPVMLHDAAKAQRAAAELIDAGVLVAGFSFPWCRTARRASAPRCRRA